MAPTGANHENDIIRGMRKQMSKGIVKTEKTTGAVVDSAFYGKVRDVFEQSSHAV